MEVRRLRLDELSIILDLQGTIFDQIPDKTVFQRSTPEFISYCLSDGGISYAVEHRGQIIAYRIVYYPRAREFNLGKDISLDPHQLAKVAHWDTIAVVPEWRGRGLSGLLNDRALSELPQAEVEHLLSTSSPRNPNGVRSLFHAGFRPIKLVRKFENHLRLLFYRPFPEQWAARHSKMKAHIVSLDNIQLLSAAFEKGWHGISIVNDSANAYLVMNEITIRPWNEPNDQT